MSGTLAGDTVSWAALTLRRLPEWGSAAQPGGGYRPDATAWAILALVAASKGDIDLDSVRSRLAADQQTNGRLPLSPDCQEAFWITLFRMTETSILQRAVS